MDGFLQLPLTMAVETQDFVIFLLQCKFLIIAHVMETKFFYVMQTILRDFGKKNLYSKKNKSPFL